MQFPSLILKPKRERSVIHRHPWLFSGALQSLPKAEDGSIVEVKSFEGKVLAYGFYAANNQTLWPRVSLVPLHISASR